MLQSLHETLTLPPEELFALLPPNRVGEADRRYMNEVSLVPKLRLVMQLPKLRFAPSAYPSQSRYTSIGPD